MVLMLCGIPLSSVFSSYSHWFLITCCVGYPYQSYHGCMNTERVRTASPSCSHTKQQDDWRKVKEESSWKRLLLSCFEEVSLWQGQYTSYAERFLSVLMHEFLFRSWRPPINVVENVQNCIPLARSMDRGGERKQSVVVVQGLDGPLSVRCLTMHCIWTMIMVVWTWVKCDLLKEILPLRSRGINNYYDL